VQVQDGLFTGKTVVKADMKLIGRQLFDQAGSCILNCVS
jgi:hypothetical protein